MNLAIFRRLLWKEYRQQWSFWVAMLFLTTLLLMLSEIMFTFLSIRPREDSYHLVYVFCLVMLYALGCGATLFSTEHDAGTYQFLRHLPVGSFSVFMCKITLAIFATAALASVLFLPTHLLSGYYYKNIEVFPWPVWCLGLASALAWGSLFSQLVKRPLLAAFLGGTVGCASYLLVVILLEKEYHKTPTHYYPIFFWILIALCLANAWLGRRWLRSRSSNLSRTAARWGLTDSPLAALDDQNMQTPRTSTILRRLAWQQWRFSRLLMGAIVLGCAAILLMFIWVLFSTPPHSISHYYSAFGRTCLFISWCMVTLFGASVFLGDQRRHSVQFLAQRAARPRHVWFSRQIVWAAPLLLVFLGFLLYCIVSFGTTIATIWHTIPEQTSWYLIAWCFVIHFWHTILLQPVEWLAVIALIFAAGQLCSMLFRSGLLAMVFGLALSTLCAGWIALMMLLGISPIWSVLPIAIGMFCATLLYTPNWMREHVGWRQFVRPASAVVVPIIVILVAIPFHRVYSIPGNGPGFDVAAYNRPITEAEKTTLGMYRTAREHIGPHPDTPLYLAQPKFWEVESSEKEWLENFASVNKAWLDVDKKAIDLALAASREKACGKFEWQSGCFPPPTDLAYLIVDDGNRLTSQGKLDLAAERYFGALRIASHLGRGITFRSGEMVEGRAYDGLRYWAAATGQTPARIKAAIEQIDAIAKTRPPRDEIIKQSHMLARSKILDQDRNALSPYTGDWTITQWYSLPWERVRLLRMLDQITAGDLVVLKKMGDQVNNDFTHRRYQAAPSLQQQEIDYLTFEERRSFCNPIQVRNLYDRIVFHETNIKTVRRATKIVLALEAWKIEHGQLPKTLGELVSSYFIKLPTPPRKGTVFAYFPKGLPKRLWAFPSQAGNYGPYKRAPFAPNLPLLLVCSQQHEETGGQEVRDDQRILKEYEPRPFTELVNDGFAFPIPVNVPQEK